MAASAAIPLDASETSVKDLAKPVDHGDTSYLDGVRGWASLAVVFHHAREGFFRAELSRWQAKVLAIADGTLAVHVFFVLSGFVLSVGMLRRPDWGRLAGLVLRRYPRLTIPIVAITAVAYALMALGLMYNHQAAVELKSVNNLAVLQQFPPSVASALRFSLFDVYFNYTDLTSYNTNLWTMPVEFMGSMVVFAILVLAWRRAALLLVLALAIAAAAWAGSSLMDFFLGVLVAAFYPALNAAWASPRRKDLVAVGLLLLAVVIRQLFPGQLLMYATVSTAVVLAPILSPTARRFFALPLSAWLGRISFPLYLVHPMVIFSLSSWLALTMLHAGAPQLLLRDVVIGVTVVVSLVAAQAFYPVETFAIRSSRLFSEMVLRRIALRPAKA